MFFLLIVLFAPISGFCAYVSQCGQDEYTNSTFFKGLRGGIFVDIGAHDGYNISNTYFFEKELGWSGICVEPIPEVFEVLKKTRNCICINGCISDFNGESKFLRIYSEALYTEMLSGLSEKYHPLHLERVFAETAMGGRVEEIIVKTFTLNQVLDEHQIQQINFLSIDTEGGEFDILAAIDFDRFNIDVIVVEDNYGDDRFIPYLSTKGFALVRRLHQDLVFANREYLLSIGVPH